MRNLYENLFGVARDNIPQNDFAILIFKSSADQRNSIAQKYFDELIILLEPIGIEELKAYLTKINKKATEVDYEVTQEVSSFFKTGLTYCFTLFEATTEMLNKLDQFTKTEK